MKFTRIVVVVAGVMFAAQATAQNGQPATQAAPQDQTITVSTTVNAADVQKDEAAKPEVKQEVKTEVKQTVAPIPAPVVETSAQPAAPTSSSATDAKLDAIKKVRQDVEQKNDSKIIEKLERTRLEDEKNLSEKIDATNLKDDKKPQVDAQPVQQPAVKIEKVEVIQAAPIQPLEEKKEEKAEDKKEDRKWYAGVGAGNVIYNGNVLTKSNFGVMIGTMIDEHIAVEGSLIYTSLSLNNYWNGGGAQNLLFGSMDQYDVGAALKYYVLENLRFRPYVGASADYIYRQYKDAYYGTYNNYASGQNTNSFNVGVLGGVDVRLTERLSIGGEFKYELPIYSQDNGIVTESYWASWAKPLEQTSFTSWLINLKFNF